MQNPRLSDESSPMCSNGCGCSRRTISRNFHQPSAVLVAAGKASWYFTGPGTNWQSAGGESGMRAHPKRQAGIEPVCAKAPGPRVQRAENVTELVPHRPERAGENILFGARIRSQVARRKGDALGDLDESRPGYCRSHSDSRIAGRGRCRWRTSPG